MASPGRGGPAFLGEYLHPRLYPFEVKSGADLVWSGFWLFDRLDSFSGLSVGEEMVPK